MTEDRAMACKQGQSRSKIRRLTLSLATVLLISSLPIPSLTGPAMAADPSAPSGIKPSLTPSQREEAEWREPLLAELSRLANALEQEQKFNQLLRDRLDILNYRIDQLEEQNSALTDQIGALEEATRPGSAALSRPSASDNDSKAEVSGPRDQGTSNDTDPMPSQQTEKQADQDTTKRPDSDAEKDADRESGKESGKESERGLPEKFEQFLDMGEAMMRRFFGVVKEFRKEFEDNRA